MEELQSIASYSEFKRELDKTFLGISEGFVRAGYLLKQARDTDILKESGYRSVTEFAAAEYNLTETYVSRFIAINDRYSEGGYSEHLQTKYQGYGMSKLAEMLTLPEQLADAIPPEVSREEIRDIKREIAEEKKITDIEVMLEGQQDGELTLSAQAIKQYFHDNPDKYLGMIKALTESEVSEQEEAALDVLAPSGAAVLMVRIRGIGKLMISIQGKDKEIEIQNVRSLEKETVSWKTLVNEIEQLYKRTYQIQPEDVWEEAYQEPFPGQDNPNSSETAGQPEEKVEIAPAQVQQEARAEKPERNKAKSEQTAEKPCCDAATENPGDRVITVSETDSVTTDNAETQISGQDSVEEHPEWLPEGYVKPSPPVENTGDWRLIGQIKAVFAELKQDMAQKDYKAALENGWKFVELLEQLKEGEKIE